MVVTKSISSELADFAARVQEIVVEFADGRLDVQTMAGALIGSGIEIALRNGITKEALREHFAWTTREISQLIAGGKT